MMRSPAGSSPRGEAAAAAVDSAPVASETLSPAAASVARGPGACQMQWPPAARSGSDMGATYDDFVVTLEDQVRFLRRTRASTCDMASLLEAIRHVEFAISKAKAEAEAEASDTLRAARALADEAEGAATDEGAPPAADSAAPPAAEDSVSGKVVDESYASWKPSLPGSATSGSPQLGPRRWADEVEEDGGPFTSGATGASWYAMTSTKSVDSWSDGPGSSWACPSPWVLPMADHGAAGHPAAAASDTDPAAAASDSVPAAAPLETSQAAEEVSLPPLPPPAADSVSALAGPPDVFPRPHGGVLGQDVRCGRARLGDVVAPRRVGRPRQPGRAPGCRGHSGSLCPCGSGSL